MAVEVVYSISKLTVFDHGLTWEIDSKGQLDIFEESEFAAPILVSFAPGIWQSVRKVSKSTAEKRLDQALELIRDVDGGDWKNQNNEWQDLAEELTA